MVPVHPPIGHRTAEERPSSSVLGRDAIHHKHCAAELDGLFVGRWPVLSLDFASSGSRIVEVADHLDPMVDVTKSSLARKELLPPSLLHATPI
jgi:hypothetical protein